ncbi:MAG: TolC family protein [Candidatus Dadabacteria bacterium]|nr:TolC family protein [Candidatus Dadabacteria bacterium]
MRVGGFLIVTAIGISIFSCAKVDPQPQWLKVEAITKERTEGPIIWEKSEEDSKRIKTQVDNLLADGLTRQEAVKIALLNNRKLQASFEEIGVAQADLVQAGLLTNPSLDLFFAFPLSSADTSGGLLGFLSDLWTIPARKEVFAKQVEVTIQEVGIDIVATAAETASAYDEFLYRITSLQIEKNSLSVLSDISVRTKIRYEHGLSNDLDMRHAEAAAIEQRIAIAAAEQALTKARTRLNIALSLNESDNKYHLTDTLDNTPDEKKWDRETAVKFALEHRLDLAEARFKVELADRELSFERTQVFSRVNVGPVYEGDLGSGSENAGGPAISLDLPIFDQNQAQIAKDEYRLRQMKKVLSAKEMQARKEVTDTLAEIDFYLNIIDIIRKQLKPNIEEEFEYSKIWSSQMQLNLLNLLQTREMEVALKRRYIEAQWQLRNAYIRLNLALWGGGLT